MIKTLQQRLSEPNQSYQHYIKQCLDHAEQYRRDGGKAYISLEPDLILQAAKAADATRAHGASTSPLHGLGVNIKDLFDVCDEVTTAGSIIRSSTKAATQDAVAVERLRQAGAICFGRGNMSEFAFSGLGYNPHYGTPTFSDHGTRIAGGSTSGGAVAVALQHCVAALGTDTGGSLRIPAAFCNLVGFKPSASRIPSEGAFPLSFSLDSIGAITHSVEDAILLDEVLSATPHRIVAPAAQTLRLAYSDDYFLDDADSEVMRAWTHALNTLEQAGIELVKIDLGILKTLPEINQAGGLTAAEAWFIHRNQLQDSNLASQYDPRVAQRIQRGRQISDADYLELQQKRRRMIKNIQTQLAEFDALIHPTVAIVPPRLDELDQDQDFFRLNGLVLRNTSVMNFLDGCALSLPCSLANTLPVGLSIAGLHGQDTQILGVSLTVESLLQQGAAT